MSRTSPLADCTRDTLQAMNRHAGMYGCGSSFNTKVAKVKRHDPYASKLLAPEDSVEFNSSILSSPLSGHHSPLNWEARAFDPSFMYSNMSTPYISQSFANLTMDAQVRRSLFGESPAAVAAHQAADTAMIDNSTHVHLYQYNSTSNNTTNSVNSANATATATTATTPASVAQGSAKAGSTPASGAKKPIGKIYVGGRPIVVPRYDSEVSVQLRCGEASFVIPDVHSLLAQEEETRDLVGLTVIVEGDRGEDVGVITALLKAESAAAPSTAEAAEKEKEKEKPSSSPSPKALPRVLRVASFAELQQRDALPQLEAEALEYCHTCLAEVQLAVPIAVEGVFFQFDRKKLTVRYTSEAYVDFNDLTRMLHKKFNCRIWMDQLNRDVVAGADKRGRRADHGGKKGGSGNNHQRKAAQKRKEQ